MKGVAIFLVILMLLLPVNTAIVFANVTGNVTPTNGSEVSIVGDEPAINISESEPVTASEIDLSIDMPEWANSFQFGFNGTTAPEAIVDVYVNDNLARSALTDDSGFFSFGRILLTPNVNNNVRVRAETLDKSGFVERTYTVRVDDTPPDFLSFSEIPSVLTENSFIVRGTLSEPVSVLVGTDGQLTEIATNVTSFNHTISLQEGEQQVEVLVRDRAGNTARRSASIYVDTTPPVILEHNLQDLTPTYSREITVRGRVSEPSEVTIVVDGNCNFQRDVVREEPFDIESGGAFGCLNFDGSDSLTRNVYTTTTDNEGYFSKRVTIRPTMGTQFRDIDRPTISATAMGAEIVATTSGFDADIQIFATDRVGLVGSDQDTVTYATCASPDGDFLVFQQQVFPGALIPDHIFQGIAMISFELELNYYGNEELTDVDLRVGSRSQLSTQDRERYDVDLLDGTRCQAFPDQTRMKWYITCPLKRYPPDAYRNITSAYDEFKQKQTVTFPIDLEIYYAQQRMNSQGQLEEVQKAQVVCYDLEFLLDIRVDPSKIPRSLLEDTISVLDEAIKAIDTILPLVNRAKWASAIGCLGMYIWNFGNLVREQYACFDVSENDKNAMIRSLRGNSESTVDSGLLSELNELYSDRIGDPTTCADSLSRSRKAEITRQWTCDRIFCPAVPSAQKHAKDNYDNPRSACFERPLEVSAITPGSTDPCMIEYFKEWQSACPGLQIMQKSQELVPGYQAEPATGVQRFLQFVDGFSLCTFGGQEPQRARAFDRAGQPSVIEQRDPDGSISYYFGQRTETSELNPDDLTVRGDDGLSRHYSRDNFAILDSSGNTVSNNVFSTDSGAPQVSQSQNCVFVRPREESFTRGSAAVQAVTIGDRTDSRTLWDITPTNDFRSAYGGANSQCQGASRFFIDANGGVYCERNGEIIPGPRYHVQQDGTGVVGRFSNTTTPPADCMRSDIIGAAASDEILTVPSEGFINSIRCACFPAIEGYLQAIRNILNAIRNCFKSILVTGEFDTGICRAILTQYLCSFVFDLLNCFTRSYSMGVDPGDRNRPVAGFMSALRSAGDDIRQSSQARYGTTETFRALFNERQLLHALCLFAFGYDWHPDLEAALSVQGGDFAIETMGLVAPATRRFVSYNPNNEGVTTHVYHIGYFLIAGHDLQWQLELLCSTTDTCEPGEGFDMGRCDCAGRFPATDTTSPFGQPGVNPFIAQQQLIADPSVGIAHAVDGGQLIGGETVGGGTGNPYEVPIGTRGTGDLYVSIEHPYRYDRVRLSWQPRPGVEGKAGEIIVPIRQAGMQPPHFCSFSLALGKFSCTIFSAEDGFAYLNDVFEIRGNQAREPGRPYRQDEKIEYEVSYTYQLPSGERDQIPRFLRVEIFDQSGASLVGSRYTTGYQELESARGRIRVPQLARSAVELLGDRAETVTSTSVTGIPISFVVGEQTIKELDVSSRLAQITRQGRSSSEQTLFFRYRRTSGSEGTLEYAIAQNASTPATILRSHYESPSLVFLPVITTSNLTEDITLQDVLPNSGLQGTISVNVAQCQEEGDVCAAAFTLKPPANLLTLNQRCEQNNNNPLQWSARFTLLDGEVGSTEPIRQTPSFGTMGRETDMTIDLFIECQQDTSRPQTRFCPVDQNMTSSNIGCECGAQIFGESELDAKRTICIPVPHSGESDWVFSTDVSADDYELQLSTTYRACPQGQFVDTQQRFMSRSAQALCSTGAESPKTCRRDQYFRPTLDSDGNIVGGQCQPSN